MGIENPLEKLLAHKSYELAENPLSMLIIIGLNL